MEFLQLVWDFVCSVGVQTWGLIESLALLVWGLLSTLHMDYPRLEGLLVGVTLAWLMSRSDKHPLLRAASAPLKLILVVLDLVWDQIVEFLGDVWGTIAGWVTGCLSWCGDKVRYCWAWSIKRLKSLKNKLSKKDEEESS